MGVGSVHTTLSRGGTLMAPNDGRYELSIEGIRAHGNLCADLELIKDSADKDIDAAIASGDKVAQREAMETYVQVQIDAKNVGCGWATRSSADGEQSGQEQRQARTAAS
jgi:hypothetical protein